MRSSLQAVLPPQGQDVRPTLLPADTLYRHLYFSFLKEGWQNKRACGSHKGPTQGGQNWTRVFGGRGFILPELCFGPHACPGAKRTKKSQQMGLGILSALILLRGVAESETFKIEPLLLGFSRSRRCENHDPSSFP